MRDLLRRFTGAMKRWVSEGTGSEGDPHVGQKSSDEPGFGRPTGAEERREERGGPGPAADEEKLGPVL